MVFVHKIAKKISLRKQPRRGRKESAFCKNTIKGHLIIEVYLDSAPKNRFVLSFIFGFNLVQLKGIYPNFVILGAFSIAPGPLKIHKDFLKDLGRKKVNLHFCALKCINVAK